jgi:hypothetical protein
MAPFAFVTAHTSYVLLLSFSVVLGFGMGLSMMPTMTAAMQAVPPAAIARTSTAMNIIRQSGASIGTAIMSVLLASAISTQFRSVPGVSAAGGGFASLQRLSSAQHAAIAGPLASAFASTFVWAIVLLAVALAPALGMALFARRTARISSEPETPSPLVLD